jgi:CO dehydrogenase maturation factor
MQHLLLRVDDDVILDMEAGLEHMGRASATGVDTMIAVVEPGMRSVQTASRIRKLAGDIGIRSTYVVVNRVRQQEQEQAVLEALAGERILGVLPYSEEVARADLEGRPADADDPAFRAAVEQIEESLGKALDVG